MTTVAPTAATNLSRLEKPKKKKLYDLRYLNLKNLFIKNIIEFIDVMVVPTKKKKKIELSME
jgi:hypothetical protein